MAEREAQKKGLLSSQKSHPGRHAPQLYALERAQGLKRAQIKRGEKLYRKNHFRIGNTYSQDKILQVPMDRMRCRLLPPSPSYPPLLQRICTNSYASFQRLSLYLPETVVVHVHAGRDVPINLFTQTVAWYMLYYNFSLNILKSFRYNWTYQTRLTKRDSENKSVSGGRDS